MGRYVLGMVLLAFVVMLGKQLWNRFMQRRSLENAEDGLRSANMDGRILGVEERTAKQVDENTERREALDDRNQQPLNEEDEGDTAS